MTEHEPASEIARECIVNAFGKRVREPVHALLERDIEAALTAARADERAKVREEIERAEEIGVLRTAHHAGKALAEKDEEIDRLRARLEEAYRAGFDEGFIRAGGDLPVQADEEHRYLSYRERMLVAYKSDARAALKEGRK